MYSITGTPCQHEQIKVGYIKLVTRLVHIPDFIPSDKCNIQFRTFNMTHTNNVQFHLPHHTIT